MSPDTLDEIDRLAAEGYNDLLVVPISFVSDHIETLQEIDMEFVEHAWKAGMTNLKRAPSLNDDPLFLDAMAGLVSHHLGMA